MIHALSDLKTAVQNGPFNVKGAALAIIRDDRMWEGGASSFDEYCRETFDLSAERARQLINAAQVVGNLQNSPTKSALLLASEAQTRPLTQLTPDQQRQAWDLCCLLAADNQITMELVESIADQVKSAGAEPVRIVTLADLPDAKWASDNDLEIPMLNASLQAYAVAMPFETWGSRGRRAAMPGTYHFYTDDERFASVWNDPTLLINSHCKSAVEVNFSIYENTPRILALYRIYLKRYLARTWQAFGVRMFVDLNVTPEYYQDNLIGVPKGWKAYSTRGYSDRLAYTEQEYDLACTHAGTRDILFVVYGGGKAVKEFCQSRGWIWVAEQMDRARGRQIANG